MLIEIIIGVKSLSAHRAEIPMLALVHSQVIPQVGPGGKHLVAMLACQDFARHLQQPILDRLWMPSGAVALEILGRGEGLVTDPACDAALGLSAPLLVELQVPLHFGQGWEPLLATWALVDLVHALVFLLAMGQELGTTFEQGAADGAAFRLGGSVDLGKMVTCQVMFQEMSISVTRRA